MRSSKKIFLLLFLFGTACGYRFEEDSERFGSLPTISVPFVEGDPDGNFTAAIVEQVGRTGRYSYQKNGGLLTLQVILIDRNNKNIGFRYDRNRDGHLRHTIIPTETRVTGQVEVTLIEAATDEPILGPVILTAAVAFDHDYESPLRSINVFSLGQLNDYDAAYDAVRTPLNRALAQKIVDFICDSW